MVAPRRSSRRQTASSVAPSSPAASSVASPPPARRGGRKRVVVESSDDDEEEEEEEQEEDEEEPEAEAEGEGDSLIDDNDDDESEEEEELPKPAKGNSRKAARPSVADSLIDDEDDDAASAGTLEEEAEVDEVDVDDLLASEAEDVKPLAGPAPAAASAASPPPPPAVPPTPSANRFIPKPPRVTPKSVAAPIPELPKGPQKRLIIEKMVLENFKSYAGRQVIGPFHKVGFSRRETGRGEAHPRLSFCRAVLLGHRRAQRLGQVQHDRRPPLRLWLQGQADAARQAV
jgi:structural maintenance of chromosome 4